MADIYLTSGNDNFNDDDRPDVSNRIFGLNGSDTIRGNGGNDILIGGNGNDRLAGGIGFNDYYGGSGADKFAYANVNEFSYIGDYNYYDGDKIYYGSTAKRFVYSGEVIVRTGIYAESRSGIDIIPYSSSTTSSESGNALNSEAIFKLGTSLKLETDYGLENDFDAETLFDPTTSLGSDIF